jgi:RNA polymerase sigma factor for flagellar operon FliA
MSYSKNRQGMKAYQQMAAGAQEHKLDREELFERYKKRIYHIAHRIKSRVPPSSPLEFEDLVSYGAMGLFDAADRFDPSMKNQFSTFVDYRIRGSMLDALRSLDEMSRHSRDQAKEIRDITKRLQFDLNREPENSEIADAMGVSLETFYDIENKVQNITHTSFDVEQDGSSRSFLDILTDDSERTTEDMLLDEEFREQVQGVIEQLSQRKKECILLYYGRNLNLSEIAEVFDVTPSRISQVLAAARNDLKELLKDIVEE